MQEHHKELINNLLETSLKNYTAASYLYEIIKNKFKGNEDSKEFKEITQIFIDKAPTPELYKLIKPYYDEKTKCQIERMIKTIGIKGVCIKQNEEL